MDGIGSIIMLIIWIFVINLISRFFKKIFGKQDPNKPVSTSQQKPQQTFQDIFRELQKKMEETQSKQNIPPYAERKMIPVKEVKPHVEVKKVKPEVNFQQVYQSKDVISDREKKSDAEFKKFIREERKREHDAESSKLDKKIYTSEAQEEQGVPFELDLRNAIIGSIILERPYS